MILDIELLIEFNKLLMIINRNLKILIRLSFPFNINRKKEIKSIFF